MKHAVNYVDPETSARREHPHGFELIQLINSALCYGDKATPADHGTGLAHAIEKSWREMLESGTYVWPVFDPQCPSLGLAEA